MEEKYVREKTKEQKIIGNKNISKYSLNIFNYLLMTVLQDEINKRKFL